MGGFVLAASQTIHPQSMNKTAMTKHELHTQKHTRAPCLPAHSPSHTIPHSEGAGQRMCWTLDETRCLHRGWAELQRGQNGSYTATQLNGTITLNVHQLLAYQLSQVS